MKRLKKRIISVFSIFSIFSILFAILPMSALANECMLSPESMLSRNTSSLSTDNYIDIWDGSLATDYDGGDGSESNPYQIATGAQLAKLAYDNNNGKLRGYKYFVLTKDIYLNDITDSKWYESTNVIPWTSIGLENGPAFGCNFDGFGFTIYGIYINESEKNCCGLFGYTNSAIIKNLKISDSYICGQNNVGAIIGQGQTTTISNCQSNAIVIGENNVGGIAGLDNAGTYEYCANYGTATGKESIAGIVGMLYYGKFGASYTVSSSYNEGKISGARNVGGIVGAVSNVDTADTIVINCYNSGPITGLEHSIGGIVGYLGPWRTLKNCYNVGDISSDNPNVSIGGIIGKRDVLNSVSNCYYLDTSAKTAFGGDTDTSRARTKEELASVATFIGYDFNTVWGWISDEPYPQIIFPGKRNYAKITVVDKATNAVITDYAVDIDPSAELYFITVNATENLSYIIGNYSAFAVATQITISKDGYENIVFSSDNLQSHSLLSHAKDNVIYLTPETSMEPGEPEIDLEQQAYIFEHANFFRTEYSWLTKTKGFANAYWQFDDGDFLVFANLGNWMSNVSEVLSGEITDIKFSGTYYELFMADLMIAMTDTDKGVPLNISVFENYKNANLATVDNWIKKFKEIDANKSTLLKPVEIDAWTSFISDIEYMTNGKGKVGWDALAFDLESFLNGEDRDYEIQEPTRKLLEFITSDDFVERNYQMFNDVFEGMSVANEVSDYIINAADSIEAFQKSTQAYVAATTCTQIYSELFSVLDSAAARMEDDQRNDLISAMEPYRTIASDPSAIYWNCAEDLFKNTVHFTYNSFMKEYIKNTAYTAVAKAIGCPASAIKSLVMAYNIGFSIGDALTGLSEKSEQYTFIYYIAPLEKALEETAVQYGNELLASNNYDAAKNFDTAFALLKATNKYLYHCMYELGASGSALQVGDHYFGQLPVIMDFSSKLMNDWDRVKCHGNYNVISGGYKCIVIQCPVDIFVYNPENQLLVSIVDETIVKDNEHIPVYLANGKKTLLLPLDQHYTLRISPWADGVMSYYVIEVGNDIRTVEFYNVPLTAGADYRGNVPAGFGIDAQLYALGTEDGTVVESNYDSTDTDAYLSVPDNLFWEGATAQWNASENAVGYSVFLYQNGKFVKCVNTNATQYNFSNEIVEKGEYSFDVIAISGSNLFKDSRRSFMSRALHYLDESPEVPVTGVELNTQKIELNRVGDVYQIEADVTPINATNQIVNWVSSNPNVATVTDAGLVTAVSNGVTTITATTQDGGYTATCEVLVELTEDPNVPVTGVELNTKRITLSQIGNTYQLEADITPISATNQAVTWASSNSNVATVTDAGLVTAVSEGTATITVTTEDGQKVATCTVTVRIESGSGGTGGGGSSGSTTPTSYTITAVDTNGGALTIIPKTARKGQTVTITAVPDEGFTLKTLSVTDKTGNKIELTRKTETSYTFKMPASKVTVSATFTEIVVEPEPIVLPFDDISQSAWYYGAVEYVYSNDMMQGTSATTFSPEVEMSRGMIATVLYRLTNAPTLTGSTPFSDVGGNEWYTDAIQWAAENNIMSGYGNNRFGPMDSVTREQLAVILYNYTASNGISVEAAGDLSVFHDAEDTSDWAEKAISWAVGVGLLSGKGNGILDPTGTATRAEVAQILMNYCTKVVLVSKT
ncbi:Ig-like domain-containing protein [Pseudoflavonifractor phocaeensis]|uniref:Ig-like domain-containing protein n=1 Tax=Pseudoflavonifractor phocaeensis TaxID=1870988 RepID=UPI00195AC9BB|nr:Ig-like domain-containing protein [Pseudoflavonifractor phocaeensis]MBM6887941.1 Ig-like domain-containing protein [Pseudoflavonifractor phocaeensis]